MRSILMQLFELLEIFLRFDVMVLEMRSRYSEYEVKAIGVEAFGRGDGKGCEGVIHTFLGIGKAKRKHLTFFSDSLQLLKTVNIFFL